MSTRLVRTASLLLLPFAASPARDGAGAAAPSWHRVRAVWFVQAPDPVGTELCVGAEAAPWTEEIERSFATATAGRRLPLGVAGWATLDCFTSFACGDANVDRGCWYLALERTKNGWDLLLFDPSRIQKAQLLPQSAGGKEKPAARVPLQHATAAAAPLGFELAPDGKGGAGLQLRFGPHRFTASLHVDGAAGASPITQAEPRGCSRVAFGRAKGGKQPFVLIDHGQPAWNDERAAAAQQLETGARWRFGQNWWTTLDTNCALTIGGRKLAPGTWHLSLQKVADDAWSLVGTPAIDDVNARLDAFGAEHAKAAIEVPLASAKAASPAAALQVVCEEHDGGHRLRIAFGDRELTAPVAAR